MVNIDYSFISAVATRASDKYVGKIYTIKKIGENFINEKNL